MPLLGRIDQQEILCVKGTMLGRIEMTEMIPLTLKASAIVANEICYSEPIAKHYGKKQ